MSFQENLLVFTFSFTVVFTLRVEGSRQQAIKKLLICLETANLKESTSICNEIRKIKRIRVLKVGEPVGRGR